MSLKKFISNGSIYTTPIKKDEISKLLRIADRDIKESSENCHEIDWQFAIAYNAALQLASVCLRASGYRASTKSGHHWVTFTVLPDILGDEFMKVADYFNECRLKRNAVEYDDTGVITKEDAEMLIRKVKEFKKTVVLWLETSSPS